MRYKPLAMAAAALVVGLLSFGGAQAANIMTGNGAPAITTAKQDGNIQQVAYRKYRYRGGYGGKYRYRGKYRYWGGGYGRHHNNYYYGGLGFGFFPFFGGFGYPYGYGSYPYYGSYYRPYYRTTAGGGSAHVRYCLNRYRTYNVRTNTFIGYDGYRHRCRSPYRY